MDVEVVVPEVGELGMDVTIVRWLKSVGDPVEVGDVLFELDTEKTVVEVEAWIAGTLAEVTAAAGDTVAPRQVVARISADAVAGSAAAAGHRAPTSIGPDVDAADDAVPAVSLSSEPPLVPAGGAVRASPRARRLALEQGVDLAAVQGSGPDGLIVERDVLAASGRTDPGA